MSEVKTVEVVYDGRLVGRVALDGNRLERFQYDLGYLQDKGVSISPFELPATPDLFVARSDPFEGGFGVFDDCLPDGWGLLIQDRYLRKRGINPRSLNMLERLCIVGSTGRGALQFCPDRSVTAESDYVALNRLAQEAARILDDAAYDGEGIEQLQLRGGSPGGARPKVFVRDGDRELLVKFRAKGDPETIGEEEYRYSLLAKRCGVDMPETFLLEGKYFAVERFDRTRDGRRAHVVSVAGLLGADYRIPSIDYEHVFRVCAALTHSAAQLWRVYRLMCFNYLIGNKDDHAKNFSFVYAYSRHPSDGEWRLSPAYDLLPSDGLNGYHTTSINDSITPKDSDLTALASRMGLEKNMARRVLEEMRATVEGAR